MKIYDIALTILLTATFLIGYPMQLLMVGGVPVLQLMIAAGVLIYTPILIRRISLDILWFLAILVLIWAVIFLHLMHDLREHGLFALRDASHYLDMSSALLGFAVGARLMPRLERLPVVLLFLSAGILLLYPMRLTLGPALPAITNSHGQSISMLSYTSLASTVIAASFHFFTSNSNAKPIKLISVCLLLSLTVVFLQTRTIYLQIIACAAISIYLNPRLARYLPFAAIAGFFFIAVLAPLGSTFGRLGVELDPSAIVKHFAAMIGVRSEGFEGAAEGVDLRLEWWKDALDRIHASINTTLFGVGFGEPLTSFMLADGVEVRELHNSFMSSLARIGYIGLLLVLAMQFLAISRYIRIIGAAKRNYSEMVPRVSFWIFYAACVLVYSLGEDAFEKPFNAIPYYFGFGLLLRYSRSIIPSHGTTRGPEKVTLPPK